MLKTFLLSLSLLTVTLATAKPTPNIIFILADDLGYGDLGCYGAPDIATPNLDKLASEGIRFTDAYANGAICSPTRMAFLTGRYQQRVGMENALTYQEMGRGIPPGGTTVATRLKESGYTNGLSGKWHLGYDDNRQPTAQGFDHFFGLLGGNHHYFQHMDRIGVHDLWRDTESVKREGYSTDLVTEDALAFIEENKENPFFLYLSHPAPHFPWQGPDDEGKLVEPKKKSWQTGDRETYIAMVERMDQGIGEVIDLIDKQGLGENTLIVFTSDNGGHTYSRNTPMRDYKGTLYEGGIRVPCIARWTGTIPAGKTTRQVAITMDWSATFARLAGIPADPSVEDGIDLTPILTGEKAPIERTLFWRSRPGPKRKNVEVRRAVRDGAWKLLEIEGQPIQLYNLELDIAETTNEAENHPDLVKTLQSKITAWEKEVGP
ncbi:MAG: hypothetical protein CMO55_23935 [Verrucomicrobiales bacterium]|nr:hypothetical protein [Verrucomicrobiales bacterium]